MFSNDGERLDVILRFLNEVIQCFFVCGKNTWDTTYYSKHSIFVLKHVWRGSLIACVQPTVPNPKIFSLLSYISKFEKLES